MRPSKEFNEKYDSREVMFLDNLDGYLDLYGETSHSSAYFCCSCSLGYISTHPGDNRSLLQGKFKKSKTAIEAVKMVCSEGRGGNSLWPLAVLALRNWRPLVEEHPWFLKVRL